jgi:glycosyltransferase involved in cell wall biosynthesis
MGLEPKVHLDNPVYGGAAHAPVFTVVIPLFNEVDCLPELYGRICTVMDGLGEPWELLMVDDGSTDGTTELVQSYADADKRVVPIIFVRNFGHQSALTAGLDHSRGESVIFLDSDLQDPPELIPEFVKRWREGHKIVSGVRAPHAAESFLRRAAKLAFYRAFRRLVDFKVPLDSGDFRLLDRQVVDVMNAMPERHRFLRGLSAWTGYPQTEVVYQRPARFAGRSKYPLRRLVGLALDGVTGFSYVPLKLLLFVGLSIAILSAVAMPIVVILRLVGVFGLTGQTTVFLGVMFFGGVQMLSIGILGEYLGRVYDEVKGRPLYLLRNTINQGPGEPTPIGRPATDARSRATERNS